MYIKKFRWLKIIVELKNYTRVRYHDGDLMQNYSRKIFIENKIKFCIHDCRNEIFFQLLLPFHDYPLWRILWIRFHVFILGWYFVEQKLNHILCTLHQNRLFIEIRHIYVHAQYAWIYISLKIYLYMHLCAYII